MPAFADCLKNGINVQMYRMQLSPFQVAIFTRSLEQIANDPSKFINFLDLKFIKNFISWLHT